MMTAMLGPRFAIAADGRPLTAAWSASGTSRASITRFTLRYELPSPGTLQIRALFPCDPNHQTFLNVYEGKGSRSHPRSRASLVRYSPAPAGASGR
jgi:hypothetical protein